MANPEEDVATVAELLFSGDPNVWKNLEKFPILNKKVEMLIAFYHQLDPMFTADYFHKLPPLPADSTSAKPVTPEAPSKP